MSRISQLLMQQNKPWNPRMGPKPTPAQTAQKLVTQAASQINNPQERQKFLKELGYQEVSGRGGKQIKQTGSPVLGGFIPPQGSSERIIEAFEKTPQEAATNLGRTTREAAFNTEKFYENLGETPREEASRKAAEAKYEAERPFREAEAAERQAEESRQALERQLSEQARVKAESQAQLAEAERQARIAGRRSAATSARLRSQSQIEQAQTQQSLSQTAQTIQAARRAGPGATVGQPRRAQTRVSSGLGIGGYGGARASRVSPTGLNI